MHDDRSKRGLGIAATLALFTLAGGARADGIAPHYMVLSPGIGGPETQNGGAGNEQADVVAIQRGEDVYLVSVYMNSDTFGPFWQCRCSSVRLSPGEEPVIAVDRKQLTHNYFVGDRPCNHPRAATDGDAIVWLWGSDAETANVQTYAQVIDESCEPQSAPIRISNNANNNEGAPDIVHSGAGRFTAGYLSQGNTDRSYARGLALVGGALTETYLTSVVTPANIGRPAIAPGSGDRALFCAAQGDQRPPEDGVRCAWLDTSSGALLWSTFIAESNPLAKSYMNQPAVASLGGNRFGVQIVESTGEGKKKNLKGSSTQHLYVIEASDVGMTQLAHQAGIGLYQSHPTICSGAYGLDGDLTVAVFDASITGLGQPGLQMVRFDGAAMSVDAGKDSWVASPWGDSGHIQNIYGQNPNTQGRGFLRCLGSVPNPSFALEGGFRPQVKSFFVAPHDGRRPGENKNALVMSFIPGEVVAPAEPEPPTTDEPTGATGTTAASGGPTPEGGEGGADGAPYGNYTRFENGGCSAGGRPSPGAWLHALLLGSALVLRRKAGRHA